MAVLVLLNNFLHDFSAAGWLFGTVILISLCRKDICCRDSTKAIADILKIVLSLMRLSIAGIVVFGLFRALAYKQYEWSAAAGRNQVILLIVKHIILTAVFVPGLVYYIRVNRFVGKTSSEKTE
ncbi:MAG: hypothetical protein JSU94_06205 [Phycisphaerales bacterium]|nr:MAG: hypothetical protein JSU94_06205 [Phycisphaerales bacterium]